MTAARRFPVPHAVVAVGAALLAAAVASPQTVYLRSSAPRGFVLTNCTNASPVVCTTDAAHQLSNADLITVVNVRGNTAANGTRYAKTAGYSGTQFALYSDAALSVPVAGNGAWSSGAFGDATGGVVHGGKVQAFTLRAQPSAWFDGPDGRVMKDLALSTSSGLTSLVVASGTATVTTSTAHNRSSGDKIGIWNSGNSALNNGGNPYTVTVTGPTTYTFSTAAPDGPYAAAGMRLSAFGHSGNPVWAKVVAASDSMVTGSPPAYRAFRNSDMPGFCAVMAVRYLVDPSKTAQRDGAVWCLQNFERTVGSNFACKENMNYCGNPDTDYLSFGLKYTALLYDIVRGDMTPADRATFAAKVLNDRADSCTVPAPIPSAGRTITSSGTTVTGTGTLWLTDPDPAQRLAVGDSLYLDFATAASFQVTAVNSDTSATVHAIMGASDSAFETVKKWQAGDCGAVWFTKHHPAHPIVHPADYPATGGASNFGMADVGNTAYTKAMGGISLAASLAADDPRAVTYLQDMWTYWWDNNYRIAVNSHTGFTQSGSFYTYGRTSIDVPFLNFVVGNAVQGFPDLDSTGYYVSRHLPMLVYSWLPDSTLGSGSSPFPMRWGAETGQNQVAGDSPSGPGIANPAFLLNRATDEARYYKSWLTNKWNLAGSGVYSGFLPGYFWFLDPNVQPLDYTTRPRQYLFRSHSYDTCLALVGSLCDPNYDYAGWVSRAGWTSNSDTHLSVLAADYFLGTTGSRAGSSSGGDHDNPLAGVYRIYKNGYLLASDSLAPGQTDAGISGWFPQQKDSMPILGTNSFAVLRASQAGQKSDARVLRWAGADPTGTAASLYSYGLIDMTQWWNASQTGTPQRSHRHVVHLKKPGRDELVVSYDDVATTIGTTHQFRLHYVNNGGGAFPVYGVPNAEGVTTCPDAGGCASLNATRHVLSQSSQNTLITRILAPDPAKIRVYTETGPQCTGTQQFPACTAGQEGGYSTGEGYTFRVSYCASVNGTTCQSNATTTEAIVVHKVAAGLADTTLNALSLTPDVHWTGVQTDQSVVMFARQGQLRDRLTVATSHSGTASYLVAGLAAGTYNVARNGSVVLFNQPVSAGDHTLFFESASGVIDLSPAGRVTASAISHTALISYHAAGSGSCSWELADNPAYSPTLQSGTDSGGLAFRQLVLPGLAASTEHFIRVDCGAGINAISFFTAPPPATPSNRPVLLSQRPPVTLPSADNILVEWGESPLSLTGSTQTSCTAGCVLTLDIPADSLLYVRHTWRSGVSPLAQSAVRPILVP